MLSGPSLHHASPDLHEQVLNLSLGFIPGSCKSLPGPQLEAPHAFLLSLSLSLPLPLFFLCLTTFPLL